jgi:hypothetical protein
MRLSIPVYLRARRTRWFGRRGSSTDKRSSHRSPTVRDVRIAVEGETEAVLEP